MDLPRCFLVRLYRVTTNEFVGLVEQIGSGEIVAFQSIEDMCKVLVRPDPPRRGALSTLSNEENTS
jgi:hypothetical protein